MLNAIYTIMDFIIIEFNYWCLLCAVLLTFTLSPVYFSQIYNDLMLLLNIFPWCKCVFEYPDIFNMFDIIMRRYIIID